MAMSDERKNYLYNYHKEKLKRVPLDMKKSAYEQLLKTAVNGYIKQAIAEKMEREQPED